MNLNELLTSTNKVGKVSQGSSSKDRSNYDYYAKNNRNPALTLSDKTFGSITEYNRRVVYKSNYDIIEMSMSMGSVSDRSTGTHVARIAFYNPPMRLVSADKFVNNFNLPHLGNIGEEVAFYNKNNPNSNHEIAMLQSGSSDIILLRSNIDLNIPVRVSCNCSDYYYTFAYYNWRHKAHIGSMPQPYERHSDNGGVTTGRNPSQYPGLCKHLIFFINALMAENILNESNISSDLGGIKSTSKNRNAGVNLDIKGDIINEAEAKKVVHARGSMEDLDRRIRKSPVKMNILNNNAREEEASYE